jgi:serine/threonine-protein kinase
VSLNPIYRWTLDLEEMETAVSGAHGDPRQLESAVAMVRGEPFVENRYDDWAVPLIERARQVWREACLQLAETGRARGLHDDAVSWYQRLLEVDAFDEEAVRGLMTVSARAGKPADALRCYDQFRFRLARELDVDPAAETQRLAEVIRSRAELDEGGEWPEPIGFLGREPEGPLVGRSQELESALLCAEAADAGTGRLLLVSGEAGVGKTCLMQEAAARLRGRGYLVVSARCHSREQPVPFAVFLDLLGQLTSVIPASLREESESRWRLLHLLLPHDGHGRSTEPLSAELEDQYTLFRQCNAFLGLLAQGRPVALVVDDLQWIDDSSLDLLVFLARETRGRSVFLLGAFRDADISREHPLGVAVRDMAREGLIERIPLSRLGPEETGRMASSLMDDAHVPADFLEFVYRRTRGNPLYIRKLVSALGGRYKLGHQIGAGGMGRVFAALDRQTQDPTAVKLMFVRTEADPKAVLRFQQEGALLAGLHHPNIVEVRGTFVEEHASCIAMEMLDGRSLADVLIEGPLPLDRARFISLQILSALEATHEQGIVHRDVKPANVMVMDGDHIKVMDFGIARLARSGSDTSLTSTGMTLGTPLYMAPEQVHGDRVDARADLYAVAAMLYQMVTGRPPFQADDPLAVALMQVHDVPIPPRAIRVGLPHDWESVILRSLSKYPADRFQSAVAMGRAVASLPTDVPAAASAPAVTTISSDPLRRGWLGSRQAELHDRRLRAAGGLGAVAAVAAAVLAFRLLAPPIHPLRAFHSPNAVAVDRRGNAYVSDQGNNRVVELSSSGREVAAWGTTGTATLQFEAPGSLAVSPAGLIYVVDLGNQRVEVLQGGRQVNTLEWRAGSIALDSRGHLFASDFKHHQILEFSRSLHVIRALRVPFIHVGKQPFPAGIAMDQDGALYVSDRYDNRIVKLSTSGAVLATFGLDGASGTVNRKIPFDLPSGVAVGTHGQIYVADTGHASLDVVPSNGRGVRTIPLTGEPVSVAVDRHGNLYVAEYYNNVVVKLSPQGNLLWSTDGT